MMADRLQIAKAEQALSCFHPTGMAIAIDLAKQVVRSGRGDNLADALLQCRDQIPKQHRDPERIQEIADALLVLARRDIEPDAAEAEG